MTMTDYTCWGLSELLAELERRDKEALDAFHKGTPLEGTETCLYCGKDVFPRADGYCPTCDALITD